MQELLKTNDYVVISVVENLLKQAEIYYMVADQNMSVLEGSIGLFPKRILVDKTQYDQACQIVKDAGLHHELSY